TARFQRRFFVTWVLQSAKVRGLHRSCCCVDRIRLSKNPCRESVVEVVLSSAACLRYSKRFPDRAQLRARGAPALLQHTEGVPVPAVGRARSRLSDPSICLVWRTR